MDSSLACYYEAKRKNNIWLAQNTILVSILNALLLFGAVIAIGWDAIGKLKIQNQSQGLR
jgi:cobalt-zinc-cadmium efflux system protein